MEATAVASFESSMRPRPLTCTDVSSATTATAKRENIMMASFMVYGSGCRGYDEEKECGKDRGANDACEEASVPMSSSWAILSRLVTRLTRVEKFEG